MKIRRIRIWRISGGSEMKITNEQKIVVVLLITGTVILVVTQIMINEYGQERTFINPGPEWPRWRPLAYSSWRCPSDLIRFQEIGVAALVSGITLMIRARVSFKR